MKLKLLIDGKGERYLTTESGEVLAEFGVDPEFIEVQLHGGPGKPTTATVVLKLVVGNPTTIIDGSVVPSNSLPEAPRALPAPRPALPTRTVVERTLEERRANLERLRPSAPFDDFDPDDYGPFFRDDEEDEE